MLTYKLFNTQIMPLSVTSKKGHRCWLTGCLKPRAYFCQQQARKASQMPTYILLKTTSIILSTTTRKGQPDANLQAVQNPDHDLVSNKLGVPRCSLTPCSKTIACACEQQAVRTTLMLLTSCSKSRASSCQKQAERASQMLTHILFKTHTMLLSATSRMTS